MQEEYRDIKGYEGIYSVSNHGNVKSLERIVARSDGRNKTIKEKLKEGNHTKGYKRLTLHDANGKSKMFYVHRLVMAAFKGESDLIVDHIDGNKKNNNIENLRYVTNSQNLTFRNTEKNYKSNIPYVYHDEKRKSYRVYKVGKRFKTFEEAKEKAICLYGLPL